MNAGVCRGGPLDGQYAACSKPGGFFAVYESLGRFWLYAWGRGEFRTTSGAEGSAYDEATVRAAAGARFDIQFFEEEVEE